MNARCAVVFLFLVLSSAGVGSAVEVTSPTVAAPSMAELLFQAGANYQNSDQVEKAISVFEQLAKEHPEEGWAGCALSRLGELYVSKNEESKAVDVWKRAIEKYSDAEFDDGVKVGPVCLFHLAYHYENKGKIEEAEKLYSEILEKYPDAQSHNRRPFSKLVDFRMRLISDQKNFSKEDLATIEKLYQEAVGDLTKEESAKSLKQILEKYPKSNRAGCAVVMLAQYYAQRGWFQQPEKYLLSVRPDYPDCYFSNGAEVTPIAEFYLALLYRDRSREMFVQIPRRYPDAIDLQGRSLEAVIQAITQPAQVLRPASEGIPVHRPVKKAGKSTTAETEQSK